MVKSLYDVLKRICLNYRDQPSKDNFAMVLKHVDGFVVRTLRRLAKRKPYQNIEEQELYQAAILGVAQALQSMPDAEKPNMILFRIAAYVKLQFSKQFADNVKVVYDSERVLHELRKRDSCQRHTKAEDSVLWMEDKLVSLVVDEEMTLEEITMVCWHFGLGYTVEMVSKRIGSRYPATYSKLRIAFAKMQECFGVESVKKGD